MMDYELMEAIDDDGWTEWVHPTMDSFKVQCCDCGLKHESQFVIGEESERDGEEFTFSPYEDPYPLRIAMRVRREEDEEIPNA
jgi:hypothetical protein